LKQPRFYSGFSMNYPRLARLSLAAVVLCAAGTAVSALPTTLPLQAETGDTQKIVDANAPAIVTLKFILKGGEQDEEVETTGIVIDPSGIILSNNNAFGGLMARFGGPTPTPSEIKVLVGDDTQGVDASFMARDSDLGLAWVKLNEAPAKPLAAVDLSKSVSATLGQDLVEVSLMGKFFDRAPIVSTAHVAASSTSPPSASPAAKWACPSSPPRANCWASPPSSSLIRKKSPETPAACEPSCAASPAA
jgi:hypothetical protein